VSEFVRAWLGRIALVVRSVLPRSVLLVCVSLQFVLLQFVLLAFVLLAPLAPPCHAQAAQHPLAAPPPEQDSLAAAALADGAQVLARVATAAGGLAAWRAQGGAAWDVLETLRVEPEPGSGQWHVHSRVPRRAVYDSAGQGWLVSEYARYDSASARVLPELRREVAHDGAAWAETAQGCNRSPDVAARAREALRREFLLGAPAFAWLEAGAVARSLEPGRLGDRAVLRVQLRLPTPLVVETSEAVGEFELWIDPHTYAPLRLVYELRGSDRDDPAAASTHAWIDYEGRIECGKVFLPARRESRHDGGPRRTLHEVAAAAAGVPPAPGFRRPWISGLVWRSAERATSWDPPTTRPASDAAAQLESLPSGGR
jgi:hypothetical protein